MRRFCILMLFLLTGCLMARGQESLQTAARGKLQAICEGQDGMQWAVTDAGEILRSADGVVWTVQDFNAEYAGYYPPMDFRAVAAGGGSVMVAGLDANGHLAVYTSSRGTVWSARSLEYSEAGERQVLDVTPSSLSYDSVRDSFFLCGSGGTHCRNDQIQGTDRPEDPFCGALEKLSDRRQSSGASCIQHKQNAADHPQRHDQRRDRFYRHSRKHRLGFGEQQRGAFFSLFPAVTCLHPISPFSNTDLQSKEKHILPHCRARRPRRAEYRFAGLVRDVGDAAASRIIAICRGGYYPPVNGWYYPLAGG